MKSTNFTPQKRIESTAQNLHFKTKIRAQNCTPQRKNWEHITLHLEEKIESIAQDLHFQEIKSTKLYTSKRNWEHNANLHFQKKVRAQNFTPQKEIDTTA